MESKSPEQADEPLTSAVQSVLLVAGEPVGIGALASAIGVSRQRVLEVVERLSREMDGGIRVQLSQGQAQLVTAPENAEALQRFLGTVRPPSLSRPALEALTVIAYNQPATRAEIEAQRGVNSDRAVQTLLARGLIEELGQRSTPGRPVEYGTSFAFLEYFGLRSLDELPPLPVEPEEPIDPQVVGMRAPIEMARRSNEDAPTED